MINIFDIPEKLYNYECNVGPLSLSNNMKDLLKVDDVIFECEYIGMGVWQQAVIFKDIKIEYFDVVYLSLIYKDKLIYKEDSGLLYSFLIFEDLEDFKLRIENIVQKFISNMVFM